MRVARIGSTVGAALVVLMALPAPAPTMAAGAGAGAGRAPEATTNKVLRARGNSAELTGTVNPHGLLTTFYFQFGPTAAYAYHTPMGSAGSGSKPLRVGQFVAPFRLGFHYRIVATNAAGTKFGRDFVFLTKQGVKFGIELFEPPGPTPFGHAVYVTGRLIGPAAANHPIALQYTPWPYHEPFESIGFPTVTNAAGLFKFSVGKLRTSTQFRVITLDPLPKISRILLEPIGARVTLKVRSSSQPGLVRLFGTVSPVEVGDHVELQVQVPAHPGKSEKTEERTTKFATKAVTIVKKATKQFSRFSIILTVRRAGLYRAWVLTRTGAVVPGGSHAIYLKAPAHGHKGK